MKTCRRRGLKSADTSPFTTSKAPIHRLTNKHPIRLTSTHWHQSWWQHNQGQNPLIKHNETVQKNRTGSENALHLVIEVKGYRGIDEQIKKETMETLWIPGVNILKNYGRWAFGELRDSFTMEQDFAEIVTEALGASVLEGAN